MYKFYEGSFYPYSMEQDYINAGSWPGAGVDVSDEVYMSFMNPPDGKKLGTAEDGNPQWKTDDTDYGYASMAMNRRNELMKNATLSIQPLQDAVDLDEATEAEVSLLRKLKQYRVALNRLDLSTAPDIDWPVIPA